MTTLPSQQVEKKGEKELICFPKYEGNTRSGEAMMIGKNGKK